MQLADIQNSKQICIRNAFDMQESIHRMVCVRMHFKLDLRFINAFQSDDECLCVANVNLIYCHNIITLLNNSFAHISCEIYYSNEKKYEILVQRKEIAFVSPVSLRCNWLVFVPLFAVNFIHVVAFFLSLTQRSITHFTIWGDVSIPLALNAFFYWKSLLKIVQFLCQLEFWFQNKFISILKRRKNQEQHFFYDISK